MSAEFRVQYYLENYLKIPADIKNDIAYCQRALKAYIKVHQMVIHVFNGQEDADPFQMKRILNEIETEVYEINAEQHFLLLRLKEVLNEFHDLLKKNGIKVDRSSVNAYISKEITPLVTNPLMKVEPTNVPTRYTEDKLIEKYFEQTNSFEILDSDEEQAVILMQSQKTPPRKASPGAETSETDPDQKDSGGIEANGSLIAQMSLLKPMAQRMVGHQAETKSPKETQKLLGSHVSPSNGKKNVLRASETLPKKTPVEASPRDAADSDANVPKAVKMCRLNLRQALKKARTETMAAKAAASEQSKAFATLLNIPKIEEPPAKVASVAPKETSEIKPETGAMSKKGEAKTRTTRSSCAAAAAAVAAAVAAAAAEAEAKAAEEAVAEAAALAESAEKAVELSGSSEDSNPEIPTTQSAWNYEADGPRTQPDHFTQEMFLSFFDLLTPNRCLQLQQRRSKRTRRAVHSNERADFHYGRLEYLAHPPVEEKKKRKAFLLSPAAAKRPKRGSVEKSDDAASSSRSNSSSPNEKRSCNECLKGGSGLEQCDECKASFHQCCHREEDNEKPAKAPKAPPKNKSKLCPPCKRIQRSELKKAVAESDQNKTLHATVHELEEQLEKEKSRQTVLKEEGKMFKIQMNNLFNIVNTMKADLNDSSD